MASKKANRQERPNGRNKVGKSCEEAGNFRKVVCCSPPMLFDVISKSHQDPFTGSPRLPATTCCSANCPKFGGERSSCSPLCRRHGASHARSIPYHSHSIIPWFPAGTQQDCPQQRMQPAQAGVGGDLPVHHLGCGQDEQPQALQPDAQQEGGL